MWTKSTENLVSRYIFTIFSFSQMTKIFMENAFLFVKSQEQKIEEEEKSFDYDATKHCEILIET